LSHLYVKIIILPRQARDKHRENSKRDRFPSGWWTATPADGSVGFGYGTTTDGLHWTTEPPAKVNLHGKKN
jgi:hypothetical protein